LHEPRIIPRPEHKISRKKVDPDALKVLYRLHRHGFKAFLVGGSVRDLEVGKKPKDFDVGTDARPQQVHKLFRNSRVIGRRFRLVQVFFRGGKIIEVSTFRKASDPNDHEVLGANNTFGSPAEDAMRRDLTINAMFYNIADFSVVDFVDGWDDLKHGRVRAVGDAEIRFHRDPVRVLRAVRHAARLGFTLTPETMEAININRHALELCPTSRIRDELLRDLMGGACADWLELAHETRVLYSLLPTLEPYYGEDESPLRQRTRVLMSKVDKAIAKKRQLDGSVVLALLFWPVLEELAKDIEFPEGRAGRVAWANFVREKLPELASPVAFAKRMLERAHQISGVMAFVLNQEPGLRLPKKITQKGYFETACELAKFLGHNLRALAGPPGKANKKKKRRPRRRRPRKKPEAKAANKNQ
jgi:poly(A) polymerase